MNCLKCNKDIGSALGICAECQSKRNQREISSNTEEVKESLFSKIAGIFSPFIENPQFLLIPVGIITFFLFLNQYLGDQNLDIKLTSQQVEFSTSDKKSLLAFRRGQSTTFDGRIYSFENRSFRIDNGGFCGLLIAVTEKDFEELRKCKGCKAPFLNQYAKFFALLPSSTEELSKIRNSNFQYGDRIRLKGETVTFDKGELDGRKFMFNLSNLNAMLVTQMDES